VATAVSTVVEELGDVEYLRALHGAGVALYYSISLPQPTIVVLDHKHAFRLEDSLPTNLRLRSLARGEDIYLALLWHRFGLAESLRGEVTALNPGGCSSVCKWKASGISGAGSPFPPLNACLRQEIASMPSAGPSGARALSKSWR